ncbi:hypothetical protein ACFE04_009928 [Oxalis oulophora]
MVSQTTTMISPHVCVIGAGPSGLAAARELRKEGHNVVVLEQNHDIGGQWLYTPNIETEDPLGQKNKFLSVHSSVYASLRLTSPREIMGFTDFPFAVKEEKGRDTRRFPGHRELWLYLRDFVEHFGLRELIRFGTRVEYVGMLEAKKENMKWIVKSTTAEKTVEEVFDAVVVATGHYSKPRLPSIKGMDTWKRKQMHSHTYRVPAPFRNEEVYLSAKSLNNVTQAFSNVVSKRHNLFLRPQISFLHEDGRVFFSDGSSVVADTILYCTGYSYTLPFLDTKGIVGIDDDRVGPLFEHTFPPSLAPSLSFIGIPRKLIAFPFFESQAKWIAQLLSGKKTLPPYNEMIQSIEEFYQSRDLQAIPKHNTHDIASFEYCDKYGDYVGFPHLEEWRKQLCLNALINSEVNLETYRDSWDDDELLQKALLSPHFTQLEP